MAKKGYSYNQMEALIRSGNDPSAAVKRGATPKQWSRLKRVAKGRGITVAGLLSGAPEPLKAKRVSAIRVQAQEQMKKAYAPASKSFSDQEARAHALSTKRGEDNAQFQTWLTDQTTKMRSDATAADAALSDRQRIIQADLASRNDTQRAASIAAANARAGNVSDNSQSTPLQDKTEATRNEELYGSGRLAQADKANASSKHQDFIAASNVAHGAAARARSAAELYGTLGSIADGRNKMEFEKAQRTSARVSELLDLEVKKASLNQDYAAALGAMGIDASKIAQDAADKAAAREISQQNADSSTKRADAYAKKQAADAKKKGKGPTRAETNATVKAISKGKALGLASIEIGINSLAGQKLFRYETGETTTTNPTIEEMANDPYAKAKTVKKTVPLPLTSANIPKIAQGILLDKRYSVSSEVEALALAQYLVLGRVGPLTAKRLKARHGAGPKRLGLG